MNNKLKGDYSLELQTYLKNNKVLLNIYLYGNPLHFKHVITLEKNVNLK